MISNTHKTNTYISHIQLMNFSQEARIQHVSKHFPCFPEKVLNLPQNLPNLFNLTLLKIKQKKNNIKVKTKSNIWSILEIIKCAGSVSYTHLTLPTICSV